MKQYAAKAAAAAVTYPLVLFAKPLYITAKRLYQAQASDRSISSALLFKIVDQQAVENEHLAAFKANNPGTTVHNEGLPESVYRQLVHANGLQASRKGRVTIGKKGTLQCDWDNIGEITQQMVSGSVAHIVAQSLAQQCANYGKPVSLAPFQSKQCRMLSSLLE